MALTATATLSIRMTAQQSNDATFGEDGVGRIDEVAGPTFTSGAGASNINLIYSAARTIAQGANETLNVHNASLTNAIGNTVAMDVLKAIYVKNTSTALTLSVGGGTTPVLFLSTGAETINVPPGGELFISAPNAAGWDTVTQVNLKFAASAGSGSLTYNLALYGVDS